MIALVGVPACAGKTKNACVFSTLPGHAVPTSGLRRLLFRTDSLDLDQCKSFAFLRILRPHGNAHEEQGLSGAIRNFLNKLRAWASSPRASDFVCADCNCWARCGLPSSDDCLVRAKEIARGDWQTRRRVRALSQAMGYFALLGPR